MKAFRGTPLFVSITAVIGTYGALEAIAFIVIATAFGCSPALPCVYLGVQIFFHIFLCPFSPWVDRLFFIT